MSVLHRCTDQLGGSTRIALGYHDETYDRHHDNRVGHEEGIEDDKAATETSFEADDKRDWEEENIEVYQAREARCRYVPGVELKTGARQRGIPCFCNRSTLEHCTYPDGYKPARDERARDPQENPEDAIIQAENAGVEENGGQFSEADSPVEEEQRRKEVRKPDAGVVTEADSEP